MKKRLIVLPLLALASGILAGCGDEGANNEPVAPTPPAKHVHTFDTTKWSFDDTQHWHPATCQHIDQKSDVGYHIDEDWDTACDVCGAYVDPGEPDESKLGPDEVFGHARAEKLEDGHSYYLGVCKYNENEKLMFINGEPHKDAKGVYPFYMSESQVTSETDLLNCATVTVDYVDDTHFTLQISKSGATNDGKYISIYTAVSSFGKNVLSINCASAVGDKFDDGKGHLTDCNYNFEWINNYHGYACQTAAVVMLDDRNEETASPKFLGTGGEYVSMDCKSYSEAFADDYNFAYFYEVEAAE